MRVPKEIVYRRYENVTECSPHAMRIMGLFYDNINDVLYTCSEDKTIKTIENKETTNGKRIFAIHF